METIKLHNWITVSDYSTKHSISKQAIYKRIERGNLQARKLGGVLLIYIDE